jgi:hypothetical protein
MIENRYHTRAAKKFMVHVNGKLYYGHDISLYGMSFSVSGTQVSAFLNGQVVNLRVCYKIKNNIKFYHVTGNIVNVRTVNDNGDLFYIYGVKIHTSGSFIHEHVELSTHSDQINDYCDEGSYETFIKYTLANEDAKKPEESIERHCIEDLKMILQSIQHTIKQQDPASAIAKISDLTLEGLMTIEQVMGE